MTRTIRNAALGLVAAGALGMPAVAAPVVAAPQREPLRPPQAATAVATTTPANWTYVNWATAFTAKQARELPEGQIDFAGFPLDVTFDSAGRVWGIGEFGMQAVQTNAAGTGLLRRPIPLITYVDGNGTLLGWTEPFTRALGGYSPTSDLAESIQRAGTSIWVAQGGEQDALATKNHSLLTRYDSASPSTVCAVPLPGDNNEVMGLAYDSTRGRIWFAESAGDHRQGTGAYSTLGWVKAAGLGARCQNSLDYGGDPRLTAKQDAAVRAAAQTTLNSLQCTATQEANETGNCVHIVAGVSLPSGAAHLTYDPVADALWFTNYFDHTLRRLTLTKPLTVTDWPTPATMPMPVDWQVAQGGGYVYLNEYEGNRILRLNPATSEWSVVDIPFGADREVHSIAVVGGELWFTVSDEDRIPGETALGVLNLTTWNTTVSGTIYTGWSSLPMHPEAQPGFGHSFRGIAVSPTQVALADQGDMAYVTLTRK